ncbi:hypothetical protein Bca4012_050564 [Brassica carinata]
MMLFPNLVLCRMDYVVCSFACRWQFRSTGSPLGREAEVSRLIPSMGCLRTEVFSSSVSERYNEFQKLDVVFDGFFVRGSSSFLSCSSLCWASVTIGFQSLGSPRQQLMLIYSGRVGLRLLCLEVTSIARVMLPSANGRSFDLVGSVIS